VKESFASIPVLQPKNQLHLYNDLLSKQSSEGFWSTSLSQLSPLISSITGASDLNEAALTQELQTAGCDATALTRVIATVYALWALQKVFEEKEEEWQMIAKKARGYIREQGGY
jgi:hypothetical protein